MAAKQVKHNFNGDIEIMNIGDVHRGSVACDTALLHKTINYIKENPNCYWVSTSDLLETALRGDKFGAIYHSMSVQDELDTLVEEFRPIADKCLGFVDSNHHGRIQKVVGLDVNKILASELKIPFFGDVGYMKLVCDRNAYNVHLYHGNGGGVTPGAKTNASVSTANMVPDADLYLSGHTHNYLHYPQEICKTDDKRDKTDDIIQHFVTTGHFLIYEKSYAIKALYKKGPRCASLVLLKGGNGGSTHRVVPSMFY